MKRLGVIGGLGPLASAYFMELLVKMTDAATDQEHLDAILLFASAHKRLKLFSCRMTRPCPCRKPTF
ncbi:MAG: hypothetical protein RSF70_09640 [Ruthenibacterium sp.]